MISMLFRIQFGINEINESSNNFSFKKGFLFNTLEEIKFDEIAAQLNAHIPSYLNSNDRFYTVFLGVDEMINSSFCMIYFCESKILSAETTIANFLEYIAQRKRIAELNQRQE